LFWENYRSKNYNSSFEVSFCFIEISPTVLVFTLKENGSDAWWAYLICCASISLASGIAVLTLPAYFFINGLVPIVPLLILQRIHLKEIMNPSYFLKEISDFYVCRKARHSPEHFCFNLIGGNLYEVSYLLI
jgi:hypothetical protein